jgi:hypothetical protein
MPLRDLSPIAVTGLDQRCDNYVTMLNALIRIHFRLTTEREVVRRQQPSVSKAPGFAAIQPRQTRLTDIVISESKAL